MSRMVMETTETARDAKRQGRERATNPKFAWLARLEYAARGVVYRRIGRPA